MPRKRRDDKTFESSQMGNGEDTKKVKLVDNGGVGTYAQKLKRKRDQVHNL